MDEAPIKNDGRPEESRERGLGGGNSRGLTLIEMLVVLALFSVVMAALFQSFNAQVRMGIVKEYRTAESEMELGISKNLIARDLSMAGYGIAERQGIGGLAPVVAVTGADGGSGAEDTLTLRGTAIGMRQSAAQGWTYVKTAPPSISFAGWGDAREDLRTGSAVVVMEPNTKEWKTTASGAWLFTYNGPSADLTAGGAPYTELKEGDLIYGFYNPDPDPPTQPYYEVRYTLGGSSPVNCAPNTQSLERRERTTTTAIGGPPARPIMNCVLDFQFALGLDRDGDGAVDLWDNGATVFNADVAAGRPPDELNRQLRQIRAYVLVQVGSEDPNYTYSNPDPAYADNPNLIRVGDLTLQGGAVGRDYPLSAAQRRYRWRVLSVAVTPRNIR